MESEREQLRAEFESLVGKQQARVEEWEAAVSAEETSLGKRRSVRRVLGTVLRRDLEQLADLTATLAVWVQGSRAAGCVF